MVLLSGCIGEDIVDLTLVDEKLIINNRLATLAVGDSYLLMADYFNSMGNEEMAMIDWTSSNSDVISITDEGLAEAHMPGVVTISAMFMGIEDHIMVRASDETAQVTNRTGRFMGANNYSVTGGFNMKEEGGQLILTFESDFASSTGPGLFIYLSNSSTGVTGGVEIGAIQSNKGEQVYTLNLDDARLYTCDYIIVWCKPFGVLFGVGEFEN